MQRRKKQVCSARRRTPSWPFSRDCPFVCPSPSVLVASVVPVLTTSPRRRLRRQPAPPYGMDCPWPLQPTPGCRDHLTSGLAEHCSPAFRGPFTSRIGAIWTVHYSKRAMWTGTSQSLHTVNPKTVHHSLDSRLSQRGFVICTSSLARSSAQVSRSHHSLDSRLSQRGFLIKPTVNQKLGYGEVG